MFNTIKDVIWKLEDNMLIIMYHQYNYQVFDFVEKRKKIAVTPRQALYIEKVMNSNIEFDSNNDIIIMLNSLAKIDWN